MTNLPALKSLLETPQTVVIVTHFKPDADALGSSLGLAGFLVKKGHQVSVISPSDYPDFLDWMPGKEMVTALSKESKRGEKKAAELIEKATLIFCLDFSSCTCNQEGSSKKLNIFIQICRDNSTYDCNNQSFY